MWEQIHYGKLMHSVFERQKANPVTQRDRIIQQKLKNASDSNTV